VAADDISLIKRP